MGTVYHRGLDKVKEHLKNSSRTEIEDIINNAGLSKQKARIIFLKYIEEKQRWFIADELSCAESKISVKTTQALKKIGHFLGLVD